MLQASEISQQPIWTSQNSLSLHVVYLEMKDSWFESFGRIESSAGKMLLMFEPLCVQPMVLFVSDIERSISAPLRHTVTQEEIHWRSRKPSNWKQSVSFREGQVRDVGNNELYYSLSTVYEAHLGWGSVIDLLALVR